MLRGSQYSQKLTKVYTSRLIKRVQCYKKVTQENLVKKHGKGGIILYNRLESGEWKKLEDNYSRHQTKVGKVQGRSKGIRGTKLNWNYNQKSQG